MVEPKFDEKMVDPNTGEVITRIKVPEKMLPDIEKHITINAQAASQFMAISRQIVGMQKQQLAVFDQASLSEKEIGIAVIKAREKMNLDSSWIFNIPLKMMEKREPPADAGMLPEGATSVVAGQTV